MLRLEVIRDGRRRPPVQLFTISEDVQGNVATLDAMAAIVREDMDQPDLRTFVMREIVSSVPGHRHGGELDQCFKFARDKIVYRRDPVGVERVVDLWSTMYALNPDQPEGDCGIKSVFLATCLGLLGQTPFFVVMAETPGAQEYTHVYVGTVFQNKYYPLDATPREFQPGDQAPAATRMVYPIFPQTADELKALAGQ